MASPQDDLDELMSLLEACTLPRSVPDRLNARRLRLRWPILWETFQMFQFPEEQQVNEDRVTREWSMVECLYALDQLCEETEFEESNLSREFTLDGFEEVLTCRHKEGSFELSPGAVARCLQVAGVICLNSLLLWLRIDMQNTDTSGIERYWTDFRDEISRLSDKWKWSGDSCKKTFHQWIHYIAGAVDAEKSEAMKFLYQWTLFPVVSLLHSVEEEMDGASGDQVSEVNRVSKWGDELCNFLEEYRTLFKASDDTEFVYPEMYKFHCRTALLHHTLGNYNRTTELLETVKDMLEGIGEDDLMVTEWFSKEVKIAYILPDPVKILAQRMGVCDFLRTLDSTFDECSQKLIEERKAMEAGSLEHTKCRFWRWTTSGNFHYPMCHIMTLLGHQRFSEAREIFEHLDLNDKRLNADLREFLMGVFTHGRQNFLTHFCYESTPKWESVCEKMDFFLDVCEALGDRQLTAKYLEQYGIRIAKRSFDRLEGIFEDAPALKLRLIEELNLLPAPECAKAVISCLSDPCNSDEHKRDNLPDTLKALRLLKRSVDIYSDLLQNWTHGSSNEVEWLKLLESQKSGHLNLQFSLLCIASFCQGSYIKLERNASSVGADDELTLSTQSALRRNCSSHVVKHAFNAFFHSLLVWVERGRARTLLNQLGPWYNMKHGDENPGSLKKELVEFDNNQKAALSSIMSCRSACKRGALFVEYLDHTSARNTAVVFLINKHFGLRYVEFQCECDEVEELVNDFYETVPLQRKDGSVVAKLHSILEKLYDILIEGFSKEAMFENLDPKATLVFVPDKMLYRVPFALLRDKKTQKHLFQLHPIAVSPSLRVLQHCDQRLCELDKFPLKPEGCILAVGNAAYETNRLPGTGKELEHLRSCFPGQVMTLEKDEATRAKFLELIEEASRSKEQHVFAFIHLGVHGHWRKFEPGDMDEEEKQYKTGSLQFAKPPQHMEGSKGLTTDVSRVDLIGTAQCHTSVQLLEQEFESKESISTDGERQGSAFGEIGAVTRAAEFKSTAAEDMLPSEDIIKGGFQWRTRLVVLSACNSSRGQDYSDGEVNLPRALMIAGVPAALVSQWKVDDSASPRLMKAFYENMQCGQDVATALQSAMLQLSSLESESASNIFEWGPFLVWGLPTVQLPKELLTENARKTHVAKQRAQLLRSKLDRIRCKNHKEYLLNALNAVDTFLTSASNACALEEEAIFDAILNIEELLTLSHNPHFSSEIVALGEEFYTVLPFERLTRVELGLKKHCPETKKIMFYFRLHIMYTQAMKGSHQIALECANKMIEVIQNAYGCGYEESIVQAYRADEEFVRQERAVIWRLMGKYEEALKEFDDILTNGEDYECLIQASYLKHLMEDKSGALEYARRAKKVEGDAQLVWPGRGAFILGFKALPDEYRQWLLNVDMNAGAMSSSSVWGLSTVQLPEELWIENARTAFPARQQIELLSCPFHRTEEDMLRSEIGPENSLRIKTCEWA